LNPFCNPCRSAKVLSIRACSTSRGLLLSSAAVLALLGVCGTASARSTHPRAVRLHTLRVHSLPLHMEAAVLEPGIVPEPDAEPPTEGRRYSLHLNALHTGESIDIVYRIGDVYLPSSLDRLNHFLRDHRTDEVNEYDPKEFDLLHNVLARLGRPSGTVDVVCGYRSPETNAMLRDEGPNTGVAEHSQHIEGRAIDIRVPGVGTAQLRNAALSLEAGGVGYYPRSQFVHVDVGPVRTWTFGTYSRRVKSGKSAKRTKRRKG